MTHPTQLEFPFMQKIKLKYKCKRLYDQIGHNAFMAAAYKVLADMKEEKII